MRVELCISCNSTHIHNNVLIKMSRGPILCQVTTAIHSTVLSPSVAIPVPAQSAKNASFPMLHPQTALTSSCKFAPYNLGGGEVAFWGRRMVEQEADWALEEVGIGRGLLYHSLTPFPRQTALHGSFWVCASYIAGMDPKSLTGWLTY